MEVRELFTFKSPAVTGRSRVPVTPAVEQKAVPVISYPLELFWGLTGESAVPANQIRGMQAYAAFWLAYACMHFRASKLTEAPLWIADENDDGETWLKGDHPLAGLLEQPNPDMEMAELLELVSLHLDAGGRCLLVKNRDRGKRVASLYAFSREEFTVEQADGRLHGRFTVSTSGGTRQYGPDDVIYLREADPRLLREGLGPLDVALAHVNIGHEMRLAVSAALRNTIRPGSTVTVPTSLNDQDFARMKLELETSLGGVRNNGKNLLLDNGATLEMLQRGLKDLELGPVQGDVEAAVCGAFSIHPALIGAKIALENSSGLSDTIEPATRLFYDRVAFPRWGYIERALTRGLLREIDSNPLRFIRFDKTSVRALQQDLGERVKEAQGAGAFWTTNEQRQHTGQKPLAADIGEKLGIQQRAPAPAAAPVPAEDAPAPPKKAHPMVLQGKARPSADARATAWAAFDQKAREDEDPYRAAALEQFDVEKADVFSVFAQLLANVPEGDRAIVNVALAVVLGHYATRGVHARAWRATFERLIERTILAAGDELAVSVGVSFDMANPHTAAVIEERAAALVQHVTETTRERIKDAVASAERDGVGIAQMAARIRDTAFDPAITEQRATTIAQTESAGARNAGLLEAARQSGVLQSKEWLTKQDARVRDLHRPMDGQIVAIDAPYSNGMQHPAQQGFPPEDVINCRCTQLFHDQTVEELAS